ncbi:MDR family MFS transporter [Inquilinus limosus]|uniref:DSBA oxidoreductase n=1 Tax=Inquilinus limosus MP06 TaxID=1398085 RepID=A0A0A0DB40_9PROT|nr:MDR family MFS transporter [Inquilinus limosus]KGM35891.1 DSBA oxidoreductase [Inquilinus limosus MP06]
MRNESGAERPVPLRSWVAVIGGVFGCFMAGMNVHVTNASLPDIEGSLGASFDEGSWITTAYLVAEIVIIPLTAWLSEVISIRRVLIAGTVGFLAFSVCCSLAPTIGTMIAARALQGAAGGVLIPLSFQLIVTELPPSKHPVGMALFAIANNVAQAAGPTIGGWLTDAYSWRWIFYLQIPPGLFLLGAIAWSIDPKPMRTDELRRGDWGGIAAMAVGLSALQIVLEEGGRKDWFASGFIVYASAVAGAGLLAFVAIELCRRRPFIDLRLLARANFGLASLVQFTFGAAVFGVVFLVPNYFSQLHGYNARETGLVMIPYGAVQLVMSFLTPMLMRRLGARLTVILGFAFVAAGCFMSTGLDANSARNVIVPSLVIRGIGQSLVVVALSVISVAGLERHQLGSASGLFSMVRNLGGAVGIAIISQIVVEREKLHAMRLGESVSLYLPETREWIIDGVRAVSGTQVGRADALLGPGALPARMQAIGLIDGEIHRQALFMAYGDAFLVAAVALVACGAVAVFLRQGRAAAAGGGH